MQLTLNSPIMQVGRDAELYPVPVVHVVCLDCQAGYHEECSWSNALANTCQCGCSGAKLCR